MSECQIRGCRNLDTKCNDCGRTVISRILPNDHIHPMGSEMAWILLQFLKDSLELLSTCDDLGNIQRSDWVKDWQKAALPTRKDWIPDED